MIEESTIIPVGTRVQVRAQSEFGWTYWVTGTVTGHEPAYSGMTAHIVAAPGHSGSYLPFNLNIITR